MDFDAGELSLSDSKAGGCIVPLPPAAAKVLAALPRVSGNPKTLFWGREPSGFGVRVYPSGAKFYLVQTRSEKDVPPRHYWTPRSIDRRAGTAQGRTGHRGHQALDAEGDLAMSEARFAAAHPGEMGSRALLTLR